MRCLLIRTGLLALLFGAVACGQPASSQRDASQTTDAPAVVRLAVASNFQAPMQTIVAHLEETSGMSLVISYGASGKFYAQIRQGAPFDVFLSADQDKPQRLVHEGLALADSRFSYATGALALWSADPTLIDDSAAILATNRFSRLALANPRFAPYGVAAEAVLQGMGLVDSTRSRWVTGENIAQTFQFVHSGNAELGFIARSQLPMVSGGSTWLVPAHLHAPIQQDAVLLRRAADNAAAHQFLAALQSPPVQQIIEQFGYLPPAADTP